MSLHVKNWDRYQHGHKREYPWIKMHLSLLNDADFLALPDMCQFLLMRLWLVAAGNSGMVPEQCAISLRLARVQNTTRSRGYFKLLQNKGFLVSNASISRVEKSRVDTPIVPKGTEAQSSTQPLPEKLAVKPTDVGGGDWEAVWKTYPLRMGGNPKQSAAKAYAARVREGISPDELFRGVERYAAYCRSSGKTGTEFVMQAVTFFGPSHRWEEAYSTGPPKIHPDTLEIIRSSMPDWPPEKQAEMQAYLAGTVHHA